MVAPLRVAFLVELAAEFAADERFICHYPDPCDAVEPMLSRNIIDPAVIAKSCL